MTLDERLQRAAHGVADRVEAPYVDLGAVRAGARDRTRRTQTAVVAVVVVMITVAGVVFQLNRNAKSLEPVTPPGSVPVWYDAAGLHRGDVVEQTPVELWDGEGGDLALVRTGAVYRDQATNNVWFHRWGGEPRIVGTNSREGPGGDPNGNLAVWFEGQELVVYDTAKELEVSRTILAPGAVVAAATGDHVNGGNRFLQVSDQQVVWSSELGEVHRLDLVTGETSQPWVAPRDVDNPPELRDVHDDLEVWYRPRSGLEIAGPAGSLQRPTGLEPLAMLSADGAFVLAPWSDDGESHGVAIADVASGEVWKLPLPDFYGYVAWSYGDVALVLVERDQVVESFLACHATTQTCDRLPYDGPVTLPTS